VQSNAVLFSDAPVSGGGTGDMRITLSKQAAANTASLLYQDNFSGCAEMGLAGDDDFHFKVSPDGSAWTEALKLSRGSGLVTLPKGQLKFPAPQNPSSDPNTLDDYAEGTFTPLINGTSVAGAATYTTQVGQYVKIGSLVWIDIELNWTAHTGTGNLIVNGLPFTSALSIGPALSIYAQNIGMTAGNVMTCLLSPGSTQVLLRQTPVGGGGASQVPMDGSGSIIISGFYMAAA
jgi:hypothetical protein